MREQYGGLLCSRTEPVIAARRQGRDWNAPDRALELQLALRLHLLSGSRPETGR
ncbi:hypothetical protein [Streptomyces sp. NPDC058382]|uniref:hypothetical protein n=1 Tax=unclassified Streptomyces TaxID=2593676 RepID=UPI00364662DB